MTPLNMITRRKQRIAATDVGEHERSPYTIEVKGKVVATMKNRVDALRKARSIPGAEVFDYDGSKQHHVGAGLDAPGTLATDPPVSEAQRKAMYAAREGKSTLGIPKSVGEEFVGKAKDANTYTTGEFDRMTIEQLKNNIRRYKILLTPAAGKADYDARMQSIFTENLKKAEEALRRKQAG